MITKILKHGIPFAIGIAILSIIMDSANGTVISKKYFLNEYIIKSLIIGLIFGTIMMLYNRYKEKKG